jgi:hypothetical protein
VLPDAIVEGVDLTLGAIGPTSIFGSSGRFPEYDELRIGTEYADILPDAPPGDGPCVDDFGYSCYLVIAEHMNQNVGGPHQGDIARADARPGADGQVTIADYRLWKDNYYAPGAGGLFAPIPEPSGLGLLAVATVASILISGRRPQ